MVKEKVLFIFTKIYPYGSAEQYIENELKYHLAKFEKVIVIPSEYFGQKLQKRIMPDRCEVLDLNAISLRYYVKKDFFLSISILIFEFFRTRSKLWMLRKIKRHLGVLNHQFKCAHVFSEILQATYEHSHCFFYAYWIHHSSLLLSILKTKKIINKFICRGHSVDLYEFDWKLVGKVDVVPFYNFIIDQADRVLPVSLHGYNYLIIRFSGVEDKFEFSRLGVESSGDNQMKDEMTFTLVSCSSINFNKNVESIARVFKGLKGRVQWYHFGSGKEAEVNSLRDILMDLPTGHFYELKGNVSNEEILDFYKNYQVNLFINLSHAEGIPVSMMEAISFGIPVLGTRVYGVPEIACTETGFCVDLPVNTDKITHTIQEFMSDKQFQLNLRQSAKRYYLANFTAENNYNQFIDKFILN